MPLPDPKDIAEVVRQANSWRTRGNVALLQLEKMGMRFDPQAPLDLRAVIKELPALLASFK